MVPKKKFWDQIFTNPSLEADDASQNEENAPDSTDAAETQELDQKDRTILFEEEGPDAVPTAALQKEFEQETPAEPAAVENEEAPANESRDEDLFFGWKQTTKNYSSLNIEGEEKQDTTANAAPEILMEEAAETAEAPAEDEGEQSEAEEDVAEDAAAEIAAEAVDSEEKAEESKEVEGEAEEEEEEAKEAETETEAANMPILSEDGSLRITLNTYKHPAKGFGFGLLEDSEDSEESEETETGEAAEETVEETVQAEAPEEEVSEAEEPEAPVAPEGLDSWGSLAFELGLPVTVPETAAKESETKAPVKTKKEEKAPKSAKEEKLSKTRRLEESTPKTESKIVIDLDDEDFISPENVFAVSEKETRSSRNAGPEHGRREEREPISDFGLKQVSIPEMDENAEVEVPRRRRRKGSSSQETSASEKKAEAISAIVAGVVASKAKDESEKSGRKSGKGRAERAEFQEEEAPVSRRERSRRSRRAQVEEVPQDDFVMADEDFTSQAVQEDEDEENIIPNGARSRRRRRAQHEKMEQTKARTAAQVDEEDDENETGEVSFQPKKRSRRDGRNRFREELEDEKNAWMDVEEESEDEEDEEDEAPRGRRQRRSGRSGGRNQFTESRDLDEDFEDEEDHVFTEVGDDEEDEDDDEWETDFSQHDVPGWRYTIDFIVNNNLKARKREPSSMVENIARMNKRGGKRK